MWRRTYSTYSAPTCPVCITSAIALVDRDGAEQLDEQSESDDLLMDGTGACGEQLEVGVSGLGERGERGRQGAGGGARLVLEQSLLVRRMLDVFADAPGASVQRDSLRSEEDRDAVVVGADDHLLADEPPGDRVFVAVEGDAEHLGDAVCPRRRRC